MASDGANNVFLSFSGEDTRHSFTDHLYYALKRAGISTYRDNEEIKRGEKLMPEIKRIIKESRASVVVFSENYATSTWCLDELLLILEQRTECNHFVLPVFYHVDPSDVRKHRKTFAIEVKASSRWTEHNVNLWKKALKEVADLVGMVLSGSEAEFLKEIVDVIYNKLDRKEVNLPSNITGMASRYAKISMWLNQPNVEFLAICGMGGSGKTTLAKYIYNLNWKTYENMSFVEGIGHKCEGPDGLRMLQEQLLTSILGGKKRKIPSVFEGTWEIKEALQTKRSLIVLDDIADESQLIALLGTGIINAQTKIIITTTRENTDNWFKSTNWRCRDYKMELLNDEESLELLSHHAFGSKVPMKGFEELAVQAVRYCEGNPLALEVLASSLSDNNTILHWKSQLNLLEKEIDSRIQNVLIMSYKSLSFDLEKELFLHIACFFVGIDMDYVVKILQHDYPALSGIKSLSNKCLLSVSPNKKLMMHRLLQEMGKNIVRQESKFPAERSRVWLSGESHKILTKGEGSKTMEGLALDMKMLDKKKFAFKSSNLKTDALQKMDRLKLLQLNFVQLTGTYGNFSEDLRWLCWLGSDLRTIPSDLFMGNLVAIDMSYSKLEVFEPPMVLQSLKILNLTHSQDLSEIRNMSMIPHLETLILWNCRSLARVCKTSGDLKNLALLNMTGCKNLCKSEKTDLDLKATTSGGKVTKQPTFSFPSSLHRIFLNDCNLYCTDSFPLSFSAQQCLEYLNLGYSLFEFLPCYDHLKNLRVLDLTSCSMLKRLPCLPSTLAELYIYYCKSLEEINFQSHRFTLQEFGYEGCISLLEIEGFIKLVPIAKLEGNDLGHMKWLKEYQNHEVCLVGDDELTKGRSSCVQMLYEFNIMSTSLPDMEDPNMKTTYVSESSSLSFDVPPPPKNKRLKGLDVTFKYTISSDDDWVWFCKINTTNGVDLMYNPKVFGKPETGEVGIWLSYWPIGNTLYTGDKVNASIAVINGLKVHACGVSLVYTDDKVAEETLENNTEWIEVLGGDLSGFQLSTRAYYLCRRDLFELMEVGRLTPGWFSILVGDTIECTEVRGWRKTGRPMQLNPSFTELKFVRCIMHGPELEEIYKITEMSKSSTVDKSLFTSSLLGETMKSSTSSKFRERTIKELNEIKESTSSTHGEKLKLLATHGVTGEMEVSLESSMDGKSVAHAIGIDLGTTYSCVGVWQHDQVVIIPNDQGNRITPSCVAFTNDGRLIGEAAKNQMHMNPNNTIYDAKRLIGRRFNDSKLQEDMKLWPFKVIKGTNDIPKIVVAYNGETKEFCAEEISSMILVKLKEVAEAYLGKSVKDAVITVPAYFDDSQRQATKDAGHVAGLNVLQIINEPTSAAIAYELDMRAKLTQDTNVLVFDLGGGTFDVSLVTIDAKGKFQVKAVAGDTHLGGQDFDNKMVEYFLEKFNKKHKTNVSGNIKALGRLRAACEKAKRILSYTTETIIEIDGLHEGFDFSMRITRAKFENLNGDFFSKCIQMVENCLGDAEMNKKDVNEVVLVGGSTRIPKVQQLLKEFFNGKNLCTDINADEAVAYGAAVLAAKLTGERSQKVNTLLLLDIIPLSLGVDVHDESLSVIIKRNTPIPTTKEQNYVTSNDDQSIITFDVYQGERIMAKDNNWLGRFKVALPVAPKGKSKVKVVFDIDGNGILNCSAEEVTTGIKKKLRINSDKHRLSEEEIKKMLEDAQKYKLEDEEYKKKIFAYHALDEYIYNVKRKIKSIRNTTNSKTSTNKEDMEKLEHAVEYACQILDGSKLADVDEYEKTLNQLEHVCVPIISRLV